jgi:hypothetical protein
MFHVFCSEEGPVEDIGKAICTDGCQSIEEVEVVLARHGWTGENWYGSTAESAEEAIAQAAQAGFRYAPAEQILKSLARLAELCQS